MTRLLAKLGSREKAVSEAVARMANDKVIERIWRRDHTVWKPEPDGIVDRLGWLTTVDTMKAAADEMDRLRTRVHQEGITHALLMGMGGSSLAPEVFGKTFGVGEGALDLAVIDSTDPDYVLETAGRLDPEKTLHVVSTKSGGTVETLSFFKFFYNRALHALGEDEAGLRFVAVTDPGSKLEEMAARLKFRKAFLNDPDVGGRYSALSFFGLAPAALIGVDVKKLLERADKMIQACGPGADPKKNPALILGAAMGELAKAGVDKTTIFASPEVESLGDWIEQLVAESTGKEGKGILPVVGERPAGPDAYGNDRLFIHLRLEGTDPMGPAVSALQEAGHPVITIPLDDIYDLGGQLFLWELATVVAGHVLEINPFDQPNVEAAKILAKKMVAEYKQSGELPSEEPAFVDGDVEVFGEVSGSSVAEAIANLAGSAEAGAYVALQAYLKPGKETDRALSTMRDKIRDRGRLAVTAGYGPRFLHSTGQLHKGDAGRGLFIQFTGDSDEDAAIPDEPGADESSISFETLKAAQAMGDGQALKDAGRKVIRVHLGPRPESKLDELAENL